VVWAQVTSAKMTKNLFQQPETQNQVLFAVQTRKLAESF